MPIQSRTPRWDGLPENTEYRDRGCSVSPSCLTCPLSECIYDTQDAAVRRRDEALFRRARAMFKERCIADLVIEFGLSERSLRRLLGRDPWRMRDG